MKKILFACCMLALAAPVQAQSQRKVTTRTTVTTYSQEPAAPAANVPTASPAQAVEATRPADARPDPVKTGGIIVPDHSYMPAGTEAVGAYGNGTGGSTLGSTPVNGQGGIQGMEGVRSNKEDRRKNNGR